MPGGSNRARFATTRWSLVVATRDQGSADAGRDLTQGFFARMLEKNYFKDADQARGRFRTFLLTSVTHFLANEHKADAALKRGGGAVHFSLDVGEEERRFQHEPADVDTPDRV